jgi:hypothetical protein
MVNIERKGDQFIFEVQGLHKLWAFKNQITIPLDHIVRAHRDLDSISGFKGWRFPGTSIPFVLNAGTFYKESKPDFWDVANQENCIIVELKDEQYRELIIEVENPEAALELLNG